MPSCLTTGKVVSVPKVLNLVNRFLMFPINVSTKMVPCVVRCLNKNDYHRPLRTVQSAHLCEYIKKDIGIYEMCLQPWNWCNTETFLRAVNNEERPFYQQWSNICNGHDLLCQSWCIVELSVDSEIGMFNSIFLTILWSRLVGSWVVVRHEVSH
jgi:hypothetical protein